MTNGPHLEIHKVQSLGHNDKDIDRDKDKDRIAQDQTQAGSPPHLESKWVGESD